MLRCNQHTENITALSQHYLKCLMTAAFDTIDHKILINRLENKYGISGLALEWLKSYLQERPQRVIVNGTYSDPKYI